MEALRRKITVKAERAQQESTTGIKTGEDKKPDRGIVVSKGHLVDANFEEGAMIVFSEYAGKAITLEGVDYILLNEDEIYCKL